MITRFQGTQNGDGISHDIIDIQNAAVSHVSLSTHSESPFSQSL